MAASAPEAETPTNRPTGSVLEAGSLVADPPPARPTGRILLGLEHDHSTPIDG